MWIMRIVGFLYICAGLWCAVMSEMAAQSLGYRLEPNVGVAEFFTVYGGIEVGIGIAMVVTTLRSQWFHGGVVFAFIISWVLLIFRVVSLFLFEPGSSALVYLFLEAILAVALSYVMLQSSYS